MLDEKNLNRNIYEYFSECERHGRLKAVLLITNKQSLFYSQYDKNEYMVHLTKILDLFNLTHEEPIAYFNLDYRNNLYFASEGKNLYLFLPNNKAFTFFQYQFILDMLQLVEEFEKDFETKVKIKIISFKPNTIKDKEYYTVSEFKTEMQYMLTTDIELEKEYILGKTLNFEQIKKSILFTTRILECRSIEEFRYALEICKIFYNDSFYHESFCKIFPHFIEIKDIFSYLSNVGIQMDSQFFQNISLDCLKDQLNDYLIHKISNSFKM